MLKNLLRLIVAVFILGFLLYTMTAHSVHDPSEAKAAPAPLSPLLSSPSAPPENEIAQKIEVSDPPQSMRKLKIKMPGENSVADPYRKFRGITYFVPESYEDWVSFHGTVLQVHPGGVRIQGYYSYHEAEFFVEGFPYEVAEGDRIREYVAHIDGLYSYVTILGARRTIHKLSYGTPCEAPTYIVPAPSASKISERKLAAQAAAIKYNLDLAEKGDPYGLFRMGQRYATGDGVEKNLTLAKEYLFKASAAGHQEAATFAKSLPQ